MYFTKCRKCWDDLSVCTCNDDQHKKEETKITSKRYLLIAGSKYYPKAGTKDWIDAFYSYGEAQKEVEILDSSIYKIKGNEYDWYEIVDLYPWIEPNIY